MDELRGLNVLAVLSESLISGLQKTVTDLKYAVEEINTRMNKQEKSFESVLVRLKALEVKSGTLNSTKRTELTMQMIRNHFQRKSNDDESDCFELMLKTTAPTILKLRYFN